MTRDELRAHVLAALSGIAPEADPASLRGSVALRDQLDLDSMDFLNFLIAVHQRTGVEIPEADYGKLSTLDQLVAYLSRKTGTK
ncbi:MAG: acyl carrier protein [Deltaproteobacteria bacterium]|nr:acyl carrier protein [Deltaproteobacteria bacterium]